MLGSARGANPGGASPGVGDGQGDSPLAALSDIAEQVRAKVDEGVRAASERLGPDAGERLRTAAEEKPPFEERPELYVGAAFAGGIVLAGVIRLLAR